MGLKAAVVGCGRMGARKSSRLEGIVPSGWLPISHAESLITVDGVVLVAMSDISTESLGQAGASYGVTSLYTNYVEMIEYEMPEVLSIATRTPDKYEIIKKACEVGVKGVYVEKPLANSLAKVKELIGIANENNCLLSYGVNRRFHHTYRKAKEVIDSGELGDLVEVSVEFGQSPLFWTHPHSIDLLVFFAGNPTKVRCELNPDSVQFDGKHTVDSDPIIERADFIFEKGVSGRITRGNGFVVRISCSRGTMTIHSDGAYIQFDKPSNPDSDYFLDQSFYRPCTPKSATVVAFEELSSAINGDLSLEGFYKTIAPSDIEMGMRMLIGCVASHLEGGSYIDLDSVSEELFVTGRSGNLFA